MSEEYFFKINKSNGREYLQIWKGVNKNNMEYVCSAGSPKKLFQKLVRLKELEIQTKKYKDFLTKDVGGSS